MNTVLLSQLEVELKNQLMKRDMYLAELRKLSHCRNYVLSRGFVKNHPYYTSFNKKTRTRKYLGRDSNPEVGEIQKYQFYSQALKAVNKNIELIDYLLANYENVDPNSVRAKLKPCYRDVEDVMIAKMPASAQEWLEKMQRIKDSQPVYMPENLTQMAVNGLLVRTKSELIIANYLIMHGIPFVYELPVETRYGVIYPDFTIYDVKTGKVYFWEHMGMIYDEDYSRRQYRKIVKYASINYTPGTNLIITVDDSNGNFDTTAIQKNLDYYLGRDAMTDAFAGNEAS